LFEAKVGSVSNELLGIKVSAKDLFRLDAIRCLVIHIPDGIYLLMFTQIFGQMMFAYSYQSILNLLVSTLVDLK